MKYDSSDCAWFCLRSQPKHEHIASANLKRLSGVEVFCPRLRSKKLSRRGPVWVTEALFPNYLFARFDFKTQLDLVKYTSGVSHVVHFAERYPTVPGECIAELKAAFGNEGMHVVPEIPSEGDRVIIAAEAFHGLEAVVLRVLAAKERIQVLIEMLGQTRAVELRMASVVPVVQPVPTALMNVAAH